jgi:hypothetical protein
VSSRHRINEMVCHAIRAADRSRLYQIKQLAQSIADERRVIDTQ